MPAADTPDWIVLTDDEELLWMGHPSYWTDIEAFAAGVGLIALAGVIPFVDLTLPIPRLNIVAAAIALLGLLVIVMTVIDHRRTVYAITSEEVYYRRGIIQNNINQVRVDRIQNTSLNQGLMAQLLSFGDVDLDTAGGTDIELRINNIPNPHRVNKIITKQLSEASEGDQARASQAT
jgi:uncharacterized membrane protein YdbT with pleckstrin-like domain